MIRDTFENNSEVTLNILYQKALELENIKNPLELKHKIRSIVHNMKKQNKIESIAPSTYKKI